MTKALVEGPGLLVGQEFVASFCHSSMLAPKTRSGYPQRSGFLLAGKGCDLCSPQPKALERACNYRACDRAGVSSLLSSQT